MRTAIYLRKSRAEELTDTVEDTLRRHKETLLAIAKQKELDVTGIYEEVISGENLYTRVEMLRLLEDVEAKQYDAILCMDIDRLGRGSMSQQGVILETIKSAGVKIITPQKVYDLNDELDEEYTEFQTFFARRELKTIKKRMRRGITKTVEEGGYIPNAPYGYEKCRVGKLPSLQIVEEEARFVRMIFSLYGNEGYGCQSIANHINALGARPRRGAAFNRTTIMSILKNPVYIGKIAWNRKEEKKEKGPVQKHTRVKTPPETWIITDGIHEPIISTELFERVQEIATGRYHAPYFTGSIVNPLAGIVTCSHCGGKMIRREYKKGNVIYFLCPTAGCIPSAHFDEVEQSLLNIIRQKLEEVEVQVRQQGGNSRDTSLEDALEAVEREMKQASIQRDRLHDLLEQGIYSVDVFLERNEILEGKLSKLDATKRGIQERIAERKQFNPVALRDRVRTVLDSYDTASPGERNNLLKSIVNTATYYREKEWEADRFILSVDLKPVK